MSRRTSGQEKEIIAAAVMDELLQSITPIAPPPGLRGKILDRIKSQTAQQGVSTTRHIEGWKTLAPGIEVKLLCVDLLANTKSFLIRAAAGVSMPGHGHQGDEECLVLEGEFSMGDLTLRAGDFHHASKGVIHPESTTRTGVLVHIRSHSQDYPGI